MDLIKGQPEAVLESLMKHPFCLPEKLAREVVSVLEYGAYKHPETDQYVLSHLSHAENHIRIDSTDTETNKSDKAHAVARLMLAIERIGRDYGQIG